MNFWRNVIPAILIAVAGTIHVGPGMPSGSVPPPKSFVQFDRAVRLRIKFNSKNAIAIRR